jgi:hypothetical protein
MAVDCLPCDTVGLEKMVGQLLYSSAQWSPAVPNSGAQHLEGQEVVNSGSAGQLHSEVVSQGTITAEDGDSQEAC